MGRRLEEIHLSAGNYPVDRAGEIQMIEQTRMQDDSSL